MTNKLSIKDLELKGRRVFLRVDYNVPLEKGTVGDDLRIRASVPTIRYALERGARLILASHLGRPKGQRKEEMSLRPVAERLGELLAMKVAFASDCIGLEAKTQADSLQDGEVLLLENLRFYRGEEANDPEFARNLAALAELYVNDAFGTAHRAHASTVGVIRFLQRAAAGLLMQAELDNLGKLLTDPDRPFVVILGGAKIADKIKVVENFLSRADQLLVGGGMAYTFLKAQGGRVGSSLVEEDKLEVARNLLARAQSQGKRLELPRDHLIARRMEASAETQVVKTSEIPDGWMGVDIGPETIRFFQEIIARSKTVLWNGPLGVFEIEPFSRGTMEIARTVARSGAYSIVGGGDSALAVLKAGVADKITHVSTGGGASLEFLAGKKLPGVEALADKSAHQ